MSRPRSLFLRFACWTWLSLDPIFTFTSWPCNITCDRIFRNITVNPVPLVSCPQVLDISPQTLVSRFCLSLNSNSILDACDFGKSIECYPLRYRLLIDGISSSTISPTATTHYLDTSHSTTNQYNYTTKTIQLHTTTLAHKYTYITTDHYIST